MLGILFCSLFLRSAALFHPVVFDQLCWTLGFLALIKIAQGSQGRWWLALGVAGGLGLLTKFSIGFFALAVLAALLLTQQRRALATPWPYLAAMVALLVGSPSIIGQVRLDFPVVFHMRDLQSQQLQRITVEEFLLGQVLMLGPPVLLAGAGLVYLLVNRLHGSDELREFDRVLHQPEHFAETPFTARQLTPRNTRGTGCRCPCERGGHPGRPPFE
jgi:4-amino-4-deoxy-L-arabinose transferase-like glycosyltransferase